VPGRPTQTKLPDRALGLSTIEGTRTSGLTFPAVPGPTGHHHESANANNDLHGASFLVTERLVGVLAQHGTGSGLLDLHQKLRIALGLLQLVQEQFQGLLWLKCMQHST